jgi:hypothetical protein
MTPVVAVIVVMIVFRRSWRFRRLRVMGRFRVMGGFLHLGRLVRLLMVRLGGLTGLRRLMGRTGVRVRAHGPRGAVSVLTMSIRPHRCRCVSSARIARRGRHIRRHVRRSGALRRRRRRRRRGRWLRVPIGRRLRMERDRHDRMRRQRGWCGDRRRRRRLGGRLGTDARCRGTRSDRLRGRDGTGRCRPGFARWSGRGWRRRRPGWDENRRRCRYDGDRGLRAESSDADAQRDSSEDEVHDAEREDEPESLGSRHGRCDPPLVDGPGTASASCGW